MNQLVGAVQLQQKLKNLAAMEKIKKQEKYQILASKDEITKSELLSVKGVGEKLARLLISNGITTIEELKVKTESDLESIVSNPLTLKGLMNSIRQL